MIQDVIDLFPLQAVRVRSNGKRDYEPAAKRRLIEFCLESGASVSGTALKAGINANQLRKWIREYRDSAQARGALPAFVPGGSGFAANRDTCKDCGALPRSGLNDWRSATAASAIAGGLERKAAKRGFARARMQRARRWARKGND